MIDTVTLAIQKSGEIPIQMSLDRTHVGLTVEVKTLKSIEDWMRDLGNGAHVPLDAYGRHWQSLNPTKKLFAYESTANLPVSNTFNLGLLGSPLITDSGLVNLSFLRLVDISKDAGVRFGVKGVHSYDSVRELRDMLGRAAKQFYIDFMKPMHLTVMISTQDIRL